MRPQAIQITTFRVLFFLIGLLIAATCLAEETTGTKVEPVEDITKEVIVGPGSIQVQTGKDLLMSFGAMARIIPTSENDWDFGMSDETDGYLFGNLEDNFFKDHVNESGWVNDGYIRTESRLYFNAMPPDRKWSFYAALEYDRPLETKSVDDRGGKDKDSSNFGLERLHGTMALPWNLRLHAGWDIWGLDAGTALEGFGLVYADDNPGFWLTGEGQTYDFNLGYFKLIENDFQVDIGTLANDQEDADRDLYAGYFTWKPTPQQKLRVFYAYDRIREIPATDLLGTLTNGAFGIRGDTPETDSHHIGAFWLGAFGNLEILTEAVYQFGEARNTGLPEDDYDIAAYALGADIAYDLKGVLTDFSFKPHFGVIYTSGDDDPNDDALNGYMGVENAQRFGRGIGGENTIVGDTNFVMGSILYGYLPELHGNGTPVHTGGLPNTAGLGGGRGDNPGMTIVSGGVTVTPFRFLILKSNLMAFYWNEDFEVANFVNPLLGSTEVDAGYVGTEWDNEVTMALSTNTFIKGQASFLFPGEGIEDVTAALGAEADDMAMRFAAEFIWNF